MTFKDFKDRTWGLYSFVARSFAAAPRPVGRAGYAGFGQLMWLAYAAPGSPLRRTMTALSAVTGEGPPRRIFGAWVHGFVLGLYRMERLRLGHGAEIDDALQVPHAERLSALIAGRGAVLVMPHAHGALPMVRALGQRFPVLMVVRTTRDGQRSAAQHGYYDRFGCDILDVRRESDAAVARAVLRALRQGRIVVGTGDLIGKAPPAEAPIDKERDLVRAEAFGQPVGAPGWPARFALKAGAPILPVMPVQSDGRILLHLGPVAEGADVAAVTQGWMAGLMAMLTQHPADWTFVFDRRWSRLLARVAARRGGQAGR